MSTGDGSSTQGATNHITGARYAFSELDSGIRRTVKFDDSSVVEIEGHGTILFISKGGEHRKQTEFTEVEVIDDSVIAPLVSVEPEEELQLGVAKALAGAQIGDGD